MKTTIKTILLTALAATTAVSCKKAGTGGDAVIVADIKHHETPIKGATLYVKYNAEDLPSDPTNNYDLKIVGDAKEDHIHIEGLKWGKYYLYAVGFDSTISKPVIGGIGHKIKWSNRKAEIDLAVPVAEQ